MRVVRNLQAVTYRDSVLFELGFYDHDHGLALRVQGGGSQDNRHLVRHNDKDNCTAL